MAQQQGGTRAGDSVRGKLSIGGLLFAAIGVALTFRADLLRNSALCDCHNVFLGVIVAGIGLSMLDPVMIYDLWRIKRNGKSDAGPDRNAT